MPTREVYFEKVVQIDDRMKTVQSEAVIIPVEHQVPH